MLAARGTLPAAAFADVMYLVGLAPSSLRPISTAEMHLYAYVANLVAFSAGLPTADWGYSFAVTSGGFPFASALKGATDNLVRRSIVVDGPRGLQSGEDLFQQEMSLLDGLVQSGRRREWLEAALVCALQLPHGTVRDAINHSPGMRASLRNRQVTTLLREVDAEAIHDEFAMIRTVLGSRAEGLLQPVVIWLSARVMSAVQP